MIYSETSQFKITLRKSWSAAGYTDTTAHVTDKKTGESTFLSESGGTFSPWGGSAEMRKYVSDIDHLGLKQCLSNFTKTNRGSSEASELEGMNRLDREGKLYQ